MSNPTIQEWAEKIYCPLENTSTEENLFICNCPKSEICIYNTDTGSSSPNCPCKDYYSPTSTPVTTTQEETPSKSLKYSWKWGLIGGSICMGVFLALMIFYLVWLKYIAPH
jgi:hypothetical protein